MRHSKIRDVGSVEYGLRSDDAEKVEKKQTLTEEYIIDEYALHKANWRLLNSVQITCGTADPYWMQAWTLCLSTKKLQNAPHSFALHLHVGLVMIIDRTLSKYYFYPYSKVWKVDNLFL